MSKSYLLIGLATLAAVALFVATLLVDTPEQAGPAERRGPVADGPPDVAPYFDPDRAAGAGDDLTSPELFQEVTRGQYRFRDGRRDTLLFYDRVTPHPHGILDVEKPIAQVYFSAEQVLEIRADACTFIAPDNQPRGGAFRGNVVVTLFETQDGSPVAFDNPDHVQLRTHLEEATFDLDLGQLESDSPVQLTGRDVEFRGTGLSLIYNQLRRRIERLEIAEGELLRFTPRREAEAGEPAADDAIAAAEPADADASPSDDALAEAAPRDEATDEDDDADAGGDPVAVAADTDTDVDNDVDADAAPRVAESADAADDAGEPELFYRARFEREVRVEAEGGAVRIDADALDAVFTLRSSDWGTSAANSKLETRNAKPTRYATAYADTDARGPAPATRTDAVAPPLVDMPTPADADTADLADDRTITIHWRGPMVLEPEFDPDPDLVHPDDMLLSLVGQPARLRTADDEQLTAHEIHYTTSTGRVRAVGTMTMPVHLVSNDMGELQALALELDQQAGTGTLTGPGWLTDRTRHPADTDDTPADTDTASDALRVAWIDRLDLTFLQDADDAAQPQTANLKPATPSPTPALRLAGLDTAHFHGNVEVNHPQFDLDAGQLALHMHPPVDNRQALRHIHATDATHFRTHLEPDDDTPKPRAEEQRDEAPDAPAQATVDAGSLTIEFELTGPNTSSARRLTARDSVIAAHPQWRLEAGEVEVELADNAATPETTAETTPNTTPNTSQAGAQRSEAPDPLARTAADVHRLTATRDVRFTLIDEATELAGHRMVVHVPDDRVELFADDDDAAASRPARLVRADTTLAGPHITLTQHDRAIHVNGEGWLIAALDPDQPEASLNVMWRDALTYDDTTGRAHIVGRVMSHANTATNRTRLTTNELKFHLVPAPAADAPKPRAEEQSDEAPDAADAVEAADASDDIFATSFDRRHIRSATAEGGAQFRADTIDPDTRERVSYIQLEGPVIHFNGDTEQLTVPGAGRMVLSDTRPLDPSQEPETTDQEPDALPVNFTGRGVTVFDWQRQLTLDAANNTALFEQDVQMLHQPLGDEQPHIQLDAQRLLADFVETGGLANWTEGDAADPQLNLVRADGNIRIIYGPRTVSSDHLQYTADDQTVRLWAEPGNHVEVSQADQPAPLTAESLWWDLARDRFEARRPGPTIVPLPPREE